MLGTRPGRCALLAPGLEWVAVPGSLSQEDIDYIREGYQLFEDGDPAFLDRFTPDATLVAVLSDVEPSGASNQITAGFLMASQRAIDPKLSTYTKYNGERLMIRPWHPFTKASQKAVTPGEPTEYKIEIYPTSAIIKAGDRLRLTIGTANTFSDAPSLPTLGQELGGTITVLHGGHYDSNVLLPMAP